MHRKWFLVCSLVAAVCTTQLLAQGRGGGGQGGCQPGGSNTSQFSLQPPGVFQSGVPRQQGIGFQSGNPYQQAFAQRAAGQFALQNIFQQQIAYQQAQTMKRQLRRQRQLAAIAQRKGAAGDVEDGPPNAAVAVRVQ